MKVPELTTGLVDRLLLVDRLYVQNLWKLSDITASVIVTVGMAGSPNRTTERVVGLKTIMAITILVP